jgi:hypothetical protein
MKALNTLRDMICEEMDRITEGGRMSPSSMEYAHKLTDTLKNIYKIEMLEEGDFSRADGDMSRGYSHNGGPSYRGYSRDGGYSNDSGYSQRRGHMVRAHYSRDDAKTHMMGKMEELMDSAENDEQRDAINRCMHELKSMS